MRTSFHRTDRISALLRREIGALVHDAVREKRIPSVSVSDVEVTRDLAQASVYVTALITDQGRLAVKTLNEVAWEFRRELARRVSMRTVPTLHFKYDDSVDRGERIEALLRTTVGLDSQTSETEKSSDCETPGPCEHIPTRKRIQRKPAE